MTTQTMTFAITSDKKYSHRIGIHGIRLSLWLISGGITRFFTTFTELIMRTMTPIIVQKAQCVGSIEASLK